MAVLKNSLIIVLILLHSFSCNTRESNSIDGKDTIITGQADKIPQGPSPDIEAAETVVAGYYSELNRKAGYPLFKGLELKILKLYKDSSGQQMIDSQVSGRRRKSSATDTSTSTFSEQISLRAKWLNNRWQADTVVAITR